MVSGRAHTHEVQALWGVKGGGGLTVADLEGFRSDHAQTTEGPRLEARHAAFKLGLRLGPTGGVERLLLRRERQVEHHLRGNCAEMRREW